MDVTQRGKRATIKTSPKRGFRIQAGSNPPSGAPYATPQFAARQAAEPWHTIIDCATGETVGTVADFSPPPGQGES